MKNLNETMHIILVDDDAEDRMIFEEAFSQLNSGNQLLMFQNGLEVLNYLNENETVPDIIFLDLNMPIMGGLETLREIRKNDRYRQLSVVIYSTSSAEKDIEDTLIAGANVYITKPNNFETLRDTIAKVIHVNWQFLSSGLDRETFVFVT